MKNSIKFFFVLFVMFLPFNSSKAVNPTYTLQATNFIFTASNILEFDLRMRHTNPQTTSFLFPLSQFYFEYDPEFANGGILTFTVVTTEIQYGILSSSVSGDILRLIISSGWEGNYDIISGSSAGTLLAKMRLATTANSFSGSLDIRWRNSLPNPFTKVFARVDNITVDITTPETHSISKITGIKNNLSDIPKTFSLSQNYPNPFNPVTKIKFDIPRDERRETQDVRIIVYNALGKEIAKLVDQKLSEGTYEVEFSGSDVSSGIYFYKIIAEGFTDTKRMILIK